VDRRLLERAAKREAQPMLDAEWFPAQRAFYDDRSQLVAAIKGRRAGGTRAGCAHFIRQALATPDGQFLYLNSTRGEAERLAWYGAKNDGMLSLCDKHKIPVKADASRLTLRFRNNAWIHLRGADDEAELRKALGTPYHEVWWDEAQKIPPKLGLSIREVLLPSMLDFGGRLRFVGTPVRQMSGLFYDVTRDDVSKRLHGWSVHHWTLLDNTFFGATRDERWTRGILGLQTLFGGPEVAPIDGPLMQREAFGKWVHEDSAYVYYVHKVAAESLLYAPQRLRPDGFPDIRAALADLPWDWKQAHFALGVDIGFDPDPFAFVLWGWHPNDPHLYEVASWKKNQLTDREQFEVIKAVREVVALGVIAADVGGTLAPMGKGWSNDFVARYGVPILEAEKHSKYEAQMLLNGDIVRGLIKLRDGGPLYDEMSTLQWSNLISGTGKLIEDPTMHNHCTDAALYAHRMSMQYRWSPVDAPPKTAAERYQREADDLERELLS
jgi:hypothetical protein